MGIISIGGLATGLDTNKILDQLVALERRRSVGLLATQRLAASAKQTALQTFNSKVLGFLKAVDALKTSSDVLTRAATSTDASVLEATATAGASVGSTAITVTTLAKSAVATSTVGTASATASVASGSGSFAFQVGSGAVQTVAVDATTTLAALAASIDELKAGVTASVVNIGTTASPDFRLRIAGSATGTSNGITIVTDDTTLGVAVTQAATNASFTVSGFADAITRESNLIDDVIPGVTLNLRATGGPVTVTVTTDTDAVSAEVQALVNTFNDLVGFVASESAVTQDTESDERNVSVGPLAFDRTVRGILDSLRGLISAPVAGVGAADVSLLAQVGITTTREGTLAFNADTFRSALAADDGAVAALFAGDASITGVADRLSEYLTAVTQSGGLLDIRLGTIASEIKTVNERILAGERQLDAFEENLRATFVSLEVLVSSLQSQGAFLQSVLGGGV